MYNNSGYSSGGNLPSLNNMITNGGYPPQGGYGPAPGGYPPQGGYGPAPGGYPPQGGYGPAPGMPPVNPGSVVPIVPIVPTMPFNAEGFCRQLHDAVHGLGTDEQAIINVICNTSAEQRAEIRRVYPSLYGKDLIKRLKEDLSGNFEDTVCGCFMRHEEYDAYCLYKAMKGI